MTFFGLTLCLVISLKCLLSILRVCLNTLLLLAEQPITCANTSMSKEPLTLTLATKIEFSESRLLPPWDMEVCDVVV